MNTTYKDADHYIASQPDHIRKTLQDLRTVIKKSAPDAEEGISYGMISYKFFGVLVYFGNFKGHYSFFPASNVVEKFKDKLKKYETAKGTIKFAHGVKFPVAVIKEIVKLRVAENLEKAALKKEKKDKKAKAKKKKLKR